MYCPKCQNEIDGTVTVCPVCGNPILSAEKTTSQPFQDSPLFVLKPRFVGSVAAASSLRANAFFVIFLWVFLGSFLLWGWLRFGIEPWWSTFVLSFVLSCVLIGGGGYLNKKKKYENMEYRFYLTKVQAVDKFTCDSLEYSKINVVKLHYGGWRKKHEIGTIQLRDEWRDPRPLQYRVAWTEILIADIENPEENYARIQQLIQDVRSKSPVNGPRFPFS